MNRKCTSVLNTGEFLYNHDNCQPMLFNYHSKYYKNFRKYKFNLFLTVERPAYSGIVIKSRLHIERF